MMTSSRSPSSRSMRMIKMMSAAFLIIMAVIEGYRHNWGGNSKTVTVTTFSGPFRHTYEETLYADPSKRMVNHAVVNEDPNDRIIRELREEIETLQKELKEKKDPATTPSKASKKEIKEKKQKGSVNGDSNQKDNERASPEINHQEQMEALRATGGAIDAPPAEMDSRWTTDEGKKPVFEVEDKAFLGISDQGANAGLLLLGLLMSMIIVKSLCWCGGKMFLAFLATGIVIAMAIFLPTSGDMSRTHNEISQDEDSHGIAPVQIPVPSGHLLTDLSVTHPFLYITAFILSFLFFGKIGGTASSEQEEIGSETSELDAELDALISSLARLEISQR